MKKTLLLCFIHGFKGGESTFGKDYEFTKHLREMLASKLPRVDVRVVVYPKYETRGDLGTCVRRLRDWLEEQVIDLEVASGTPSPTVDPSVRTILIGHSMGGIVAAELVIALASEKPVSGEDRTAGGDGNAEESQEPVFGGLMFPSVQGVLAFDTPYLGISPGVVAHGAEGRYQDAAAALSQLSGLRAALWGPGRAPSAASPPSSSTAAFPAKAAEAAAGGGRWGSWGRAAMYAGAAGAAAAAGGAAWMHRGAITEGWSWASSHLEFVGCLARAEELRKRVACMVTLREELGVGFANLYTRLGKAAVSKKGPVVAGAVLGRERTFCNVPRRTEAGEWMEAVNDGAAEETVAHMTMFERDANPGYEKLLHDAAGLIARWVRNEWYETSGT